MKMVSMKLDKKDVKKEMAEHSISDMPEYPYGLNIRLDDESIKKLGISELPEVGSDMVVLAKVKVEEVSSRDSLNGNENTSISLQITDMSLEKNKERKPTTEVLYS